MAIPRENRSSHFLTIPFQPCPQVPASFYVEVKIFMPIDVFDLETRIFLLPLIIR